MQRLWSPWRSKYIESFSQPLSGEECVFCSAVAGNNDAERFVVERGRTAFIIMNLYPYNNGHLLIIPNRHVATMAELTSEERLELIDLTQRGIDLLTRSMGPHGFNVGANLGRAAGAGIADHLHFHVVPRWNGDTNFLPILGDTKMISEEMRITYEKLLAAKKP